MEARQAMADDTARMEDKGELTCGNGRCAESYYNAKTSYKKNNNFFSRKVVLFNETFASPSKNGQAICILWHEAEAGRKASNVASSYVRFMRENRDKEDILIFSDNCTSQNKSWVFFSALPRVVNDPTVAIQKVTVKYLYRCGPYVNGL